MPARISHAVCVTSDLRATQAFYEAVFKRKFRGAPHPRCACWFLSEPEDEAPPGWHLYFSTTDLDSVIGPDRLQATKRYTVDGTRFAEINDPLLGKLTLQEGGGGDAAAVFFASRPEAITRLDTTMLIYAEAGCDSFATNAGGYAIVAPDPKVPRWVPAWPASNVRALVQRAIRLGASVVDVRSTLSTSVSILDPWGAWFVVFDERHYDPEPDLPDFGTVEQLEAHVARPRERRTAGDAGIAKLRALWIPPDAEPWLREPEPSGTL